MSRVFDIALPALAQGKVRASLHSCGFQDSGAAGAVFYYGFANPAECSPRAISFQTQRLRQAYEYRQSEVKETKLAATMILLQDIITPGQYGAPTLFRSVVIRGVTILAAPFASPCQGSLNGCRSLWIQLLPKLRVHAVRRVAEPAPNGSCWQLCRRRLRGLARCWCRIPR